MELKRTESEVADLLAAYRAVRTEFLGLLRDHPSSVPMQGGSSSDQDEGRSEWGFPPLREDVVAEAQEDSTKPIEGSGDAHVGTVLDDGNVGGDRGLDGRAVTERAVDPGSGGGGDDDGEDPLSRMKRILASLESIASSVDALESRMDRFKERLNEKDPVTGNPRYGENASKRVRSLVARYEALTGAMEVARDANGPMQLLLGAVEGEEEAKRRARWENDVRARERQALIREEERLRQRQAEVEKAEEQARKAEEEAEISRLAEASRKARAEEEKRRAEAELQAEQAQREADRAFMNSVEKGEAGVKRQLDVLRGGLADDASAHAAAIGALHTIFSQIAGRPEEVKFRKIRVDHPRFQDDIGRHAGGRELLVAAGFKVETVDGVRCYYSREPNIESDMDGWSAWFDGLKRTLELIEEDMLK